MEQIMWYVRLIFSAMWVSPDTSQTPPHTRIPPPAPCPPCHCIKKSFRIPHIVAILVFNNLSIVSQFYSSLSLSENNHFWEIHWHCHYVVAIFIFSSLLYVVMVPGHHHSWVTISHYRYFLFSVWILVWRLWCLLDDTCITLPHPCLYQTSSLCLRSHSSSKVSPDWPGPF